MIYIFKAPHKTLINLHSPWCTVLWEDLFPFGRWLIICLKSHTLVVAQFLFFLFLFPLFMPLTSRSCCWESLFPFQQAKSYGRYSGQINHGKSSTAPNLAHMNTLHEHHWRLWCWKYSNLNSPSSAMGLKCHVKHEDSQMNQSTDITSSWLRCW